MKMQAFKKLDDMETKNTEYQNIIFDLVGVLFSINKFRLCMDLGLLNIAWYMLKHRKNPLDTFLTTLDEIAKNEDQDYFSIKYKDYRQPKCITEYNLGLKGSKEIKNELYEHIQRLDTKNYFKNKQEKQIVLDILNTISESKKISKTAKPMVKTIDLVKKLKTQKKYKQFILSNIDSETFEILKKTYAKVFALFDGIVLSCEAQLLKPNHLIYGFLTDRYNLNPKQCIFIDDQQENINAAQEVGIKGIIYKNFSYVDKNLKDLGVI